MSWAEHIEYTIVGHCTVCGDDDFRTVDGACPEYLDDWAYEHRHEEEDDGEE